ncbi:MAG: transposase [Myxococcales bacterium]|nr:transposase [Myxococcales bacterium]
MNRQIIGVMAVAQAQNDIQVHGFAFLSNHYHLLISAKDAAEKSQFIGFVNCNITKKLNHINKRKGSSWARRFTEVPVTEDEFTQTWRLRYLLSQGVKENLVPVVEDWPGATSTPWLLHGKRMYGVWTDLSQRNRAENRKGFVEIPGEFDTVVELKMTVLPCWAHLPPNEWRQRVWALVESINLEAAEARRLSGATVFGVAAVLATSPFSRGKPMKRRRMPLVHAPNREVRQRYVAVRRELTAAYREASRRFRGGEWDVAFPAGMFRPAGGFVGGCDNRTLDSW